MKLELWQSDKIYTPFSWYLWDLWVQTNGQGCTVLVWMHGNARHDPCLTRVGAVKLLVSSGQAIYMFNVTLRR